MPEDSQLELYSEVVVPSINATKLWNQQMSAFCLINLCVKVKSNGENPVQVYKI